MSNRARRWVNLVAVVALLTLASGLAARAEAATVLRGLLESAPLVSALSTVAGERQDDRRGREAAGDAMLELRDRGRSLHDVASAALAWAASQSDENGKRLQECAARLAGSP